MNKAIDDQVTDFTKRSQALITDASSTSDDPVTYIIIIEIISIFYN